MAKNVIAALLALIALSTGAVADVPVTIPVQGRLTTTAGKAVPDGAYNIRLSLYNGPAGPQSATDTITFMGDAITLSNHPVIVNSDTVKKSDNSTTYTRNVAYTVDYANGVITRSNAATIPTGTSVTVTYQWTPVSSTSSTQTVQATSGIFVTTVNLDPSYLTGADWVQVEVDRGGTWETLLPRIRLASVPYSLKTSSLDGATGGTVHGSLGVVGSIDSTGPVYGVGSSLKIGNFTITHPGIQGTGVTGAGGEAPGITAIGANDGSGLALQVKGRLQTTGDANVAGQLTSAAIQTGVIYATGLTTTGSLPAVQAIHTDKDVAFGNIYAQGEISVTGNVTGKNISGVSEKLYGDLTAVNATLSGKMQSDTAGVTAALTAGSATVAGALSADNMSVRYASVGDISCTGIVAGTGGLAPDYTALGHVYQEAGHYSQFFTLPTYMSADPSMLFIDVTEYSDAAGPRYYLSPQHLNWSTTIQGSLNVSLSSINPGTGSVYFRVRVWKCRPN